MVLRFLLLRLIVLLSSAGLIEARIPHGGLCLRPFVFSARRGFLRRLDLTLWCVLWLRFVFLGVALRRVIISSARSRRSCNALPLLCIRGWSCARGACRSNYI